jgi:hypothetical protein
MTLDVISVESFTRGRLTRDDPDTARQLEIALAAVRHYCGWHITPVLTEDIILDGPGGKLLTLPTLNVKAVNSVTELGSLIPAGDLTWSANGRLVKRSAQTWTDEFRGITVNITHGYDSLPDLETVVLSSIERGGFSAGGSMVEAIGPFKYGAVSASEAGPSFTMSERFILDRYRLEKPA